MQGKEILCLYISLRMYTKRTIIHNSSFTTQCLDVDIMCTTFVGPTFGYRQVLHKKHLKEEQCCRVTLSRVKIFHFFTNFILIKKPGFTDRAN
jgi:hypothetical protein